jgi:hypothetical protein
MRDALKQMDQDARDADQTSGEAKKLSQRDTGLEIVKMLRDGINKQVDFKIFLTNMLANLYQQSMSASEAKQAAEAQVRGWLEDGHKTAEAMLSAFKQHPLVVSATQQAETPGEQPPGDQAGKIQPGEKETPNSNEQEALRFLQTSLDRMRDFGLDDATIKEKLLPKAGEKYSAFVKELVAQHFGGMTDEKLLARVQGEINRRFGVVDKPLLIKTLVAQAAAKDIDLKDQGARMKAILAKRKAGDKPAEVAPTAASPTGAAPAVTPTKTASPTVPASTEDLKDIFARKDWVSLAHHARWLSDRYPEALAQKRKVLAWFHANKSSGTVQPHEYESSVANLQRAIEGK